MLSADGRFSGLRTVVTIPTARERRNDCSVASERVILGSIRGGRAEILTAGGGGVRRWVARLAGKRCKKRQLDRLAEEMVGYQTLNLCQQRRGSG